MERRPHAACPPSDLAHDVVCGAVVVQAVVAHRARDALARAGTSGPLPGRYVGSQCGRDGSPAV